jgi:hypothetical protein
MYGRRRYISSNKGRSNAKEARSARKSSVDLEARLGQDRDRHRI